MSQSDDNWLPGAVRVRAKAIDPFEGKRGHDYIKARELTKPPVKRLDADTNRQPFNFLLNSNDDAAPGKTDSRHRFRFLDKLTVPEEV